MIKRILIITSSLLTISFIYHLLRFRLEFTYSSTSEAVFMVGLPTMLISLIRVTGAGGVFNGITFVYKSLGKEFRNKYPKYNDYYQSRMEDKTPPSLSFYFLIIGVIMFVLGIILGLI